MYKKNIDFSKYSSLRIGGNLEVKILEEKGEIEDSRIIGDCFNILITKNATNLAILGDCFDFINDLGDILEVGAKTSCAKLYRYAKANNLAGFEIYSGLPGSIGGAVKMNAGLKQYETKDVLIGAELEGGYSENLGLSYRNSEIDSVIYKAYFKKVAGFDEKLVDLFKSWRANQPKGATCGSCFKNPKDISAGKLLEDAKLKGHFINDIGFSHIHANFLMNKGNAISDDAIKLISLAKKRVFENVGISLSAEVIII